MMPIKSGVSFARIISFFAIALFFVAQTATAGVQTKDQQKCVNEMFKRGAGIAKTQGKDNAACLKNAVSGNTSGLGNGGQTQTAQACLTNDVKGKVDKAQTKLGAGETKRCLSAPEQLPTFGYTGSANVGAESASGPVDAIAALFGADLDLVTTGASYPDEEAPGCQQDTLKVANKYFDTLMKTATKEAKGSLKGGKVTQATTIGEVQAAALGAIVTDPKGKLQKALDKFTSGVTGGDCATTSATMASLFAGDCSASVTPADLADCAGGLLRCEFCRTFAGVAGAGDGCDQFDDGMVNSSCGDGFAAAREITGAGDLITGPLAHGRLGDYIMENDVARFIIQDIAQRDMYSVGVFGGNLIDLELKSAPGLDNFLEMQPAINAETVLNGQTLEIVNDGSNGAAAIVRVCGPDDILDFVNGSTVVEDAGIPFPAFADDRDSQIEACTNYVLAPGSTAIQLVTTVFNIGTPSELLVPGDYMNAAGEVEFWASGDAGLGERLTADLDVLSFIGYGEASGVDYGHVSILDDPASPSSFFATSGVALIVHNQNVLDILLGTPTNFTIPGGESRSFERYFGVGDGSGANTIDLMNRVRGITSGEISGCVTVGGAPAPGARVSAGMVTGPNFDNVSSNWTTDALGCYSGTLPEGSYGVAAWREGTPYEGGGLTPTIHNVVIADGAPVVQDIALPLTGDVSVTVTDETASAVPARVSIVGFDPSPEIDLGGGTGLFLDSQDRVPFGLVAAKYTDSAGTVTFDVEPGSYQVVVSRGTEYSIYESPITVTAGATTNVAAQIGRVLDTTGFISSDFHVHGINSADSRVSHSDRVRQFAGEGVDNIVITDHHAHTDLGPTISSLGFTGFVNATTGEEVTTWNSGHFNAYPMTVDPTIPSGGSSDWGVAAPPGEDFVSSGSYCANPDEVEQIILNNPTATVDTVVQINHITDHFAPLNIDTSLVPPASNLTPVELRNFRLDPTSGNLFHQFPALELWNGMNRAHQSEFLDERIGIWMNLNNQGLITTALADTDTHQFLNLRSAGARSWTASTSDDPALKSDAEISSAVLMGRLTAGQGVYVQTRLVANENPLIFADLTLGGTTEIAITDPVLGVDLEIDVQAPTWAEFDSIEIYANPATIPSPTNPEPEMFAAVPTQVLTEGIDFTVSTVNVHAGVPGADRLETSVTVPFTNLTEDMWFAVIVKGTDGVSQPMFPVYPSDLSTGSNTTLANLLDGNVGESGTMALGFTNGLYVDADGVPGWTGPNE